MSRIIDSIKGIFGLQTQIQEMVKPTSVAAVSSQVLKVMKPHVPLIKFRSGSDTHTATVIGHSAVALKSSPVSSTPASSKSTPVKATTLVTLEDWQLPARYRRRRISDEEVGFINRGGPE